MGVNWCVVLDVGWCFALGGWLLVGLLTAAEMSWSRRVDIVVVIDANGDPVASSTPPPAGDHLNQSAPPLAGCAGEHALDQTLQRQTLARPDELRRQVFQVPVLRECCMSAA